MWPVRKKSPAGTTPASLLHSEHVSSKTVINTLDSFWLFTRWISRFAAEAAPSPWPVTTDGAAADALAAPIYMLQQKWKTVRA